MSKSADAFRTISEVADWLGIQAHVLRFWESKFTQVKPIKRAGGRRYYRPADMLLLGGIKRLLHDDGLTIKGVQKILREEGMNHVAALSAPLDDMAQADQGKDAQDTIDMPAAVDTTLDDAPKPQMPQNVVLPFEPARTDAPAPNPTQVAPETPAVSPKDTPAVAAAAPTPERPAAPAEPNSVDSGDASAPPEPMAPITVDTAHASPVETPADALSERPARVTATDDAKPAGDTATTPTDQVTGPDEPSGSAPEDLPTFLRSPLSDPEPQPSDNTPSENQAPVEETSTKAPSSPKPRIIDLPPIPALDEIPAAPGLLTAALRKPQISPETAAKVAPLLARLTALRDSMSSGHRPVAKD